MYQITFSHIIGMHEKKIKSIFWAYHCAVWQKFTTQYYIREGSNSSQSPLWETHIYYLSLTAWLVQPKTCQTKDPILVLISVTQHVTEHYAIAPASTNNARCNHLCLHTGMRYIQYRGYFHYLLLCQKGDVLLILPCATILRRGKDWKQTRTKKSSGMSC